MEEPTLVSTPPANAEGSVVNDAFFIGWLPMPPSYARFLRPVVTVLLILTAATALILARGQSFPGTAVWEDDTPVTFEGIVYASPYALLYVPGERPGDSVRTILLVEDGKFGAADRVLPYDGQAVRVTGTLLHRDERWMLELADGDKGLRPITLEEEQLQRLRRPTPQEIGLVTLRGEIVDSKCYLGAMKPGGGKTHKACAALCLSGGVPPMFLTRNAAKQESYYLLTGPAGGPLGTEAFHYVGDPVELTGRLEQHRDLHVLKVAITDIRRR
jgi:hypothetical protein